MSPVTRLLIHGASGRMGQALIRLCQQDPGFELVAALDRGNTALPQTGADVLIDFSRPQGLVRALDWCRETGTALVSGTTGLDEELHERLREAAAEIPLLWAPNMSLGVSLTTRLLALAARDLGFDAEVEIIEAHHRYKQDAPSGTALQLAETVAAARGQDAAEVIVSGRSGADSRRGAGEIGISSLRMGEVVGDHTVIFQLPGESLEITHRANDRDAFARGALAAARWLHRQPAGLYTMADLPAPVTDN